MKIASNHLEAFYSVARHRSFSKGATQINVTQSAVSQRITALEENLGTTLFIRDRASLKLTPSGEKLLRYCQSQEQLETEILSELKFTDSKTQDLAGEIRIGGFSSIAMAAIIPALSPLLEKNPDLGFSLVTKEMQDLLPALKNGEVDFIVVNRNPERQDIETLFLGVEENVLVESKKFKNHPIFLDHDADDLTTNSYFKISKMNPPKGQRRYVDDVYGLIEGVRHGLGKAVLPKHLIKNEKEFVISKPDAVFKVKMYLIFYKQPFYSQLHQLVVKELQTYFKNHFPASSK